jgi:hypothetical protein
MFRSIGHHQGDCLVLTVGTMPEKGESRQKYSSFLLWPTGCFSDMNDKVL